MPDRRQGDRRQQSPLQRKTFSISLGSLILVILMILIIIASFFISKINYQNGYENGYNDGYWDATYSNDSNVDEKNSNEVENNIN